MHCLSVGLGQVDVCIPPALVLKTILSWWYEGEGVKKAEHATVRLSLGFLLANLPWVTTTHALRSSFTVGNPRWLCTNSNWRRLQVPLISPLLFQTL